jgi:hypothetical protein
VATCAQILSNKDRGLLPEAARLGRERDEAQVAVQRAAATGTATRLTALFGGRGGAVSDGVLPLIAAAHKVAWADTGEGWGICAKSYGALAKGDGVP